MNIANDPDLAGMVRKGMPEAELRQVLEQRYADEYLVDGLMKEAKKLRSARKTSQGLMLLLIGAAFLFFSCVLTLTSSYGEAGSGFFLYGLTSIGLAIGFAGFVRIFS